MGAGKVFLRVAELSAPAAELAWQAYLSNNPAFAQVVTKMMAPVTNAASKAKVYYNQADEALEMGASKLYHKVFGKKGSSTTVEGLDLAERFANFKSIHEDWALGPVIRGEKIDQTLGQNLPKNFPTIDKFSFDRGVATSIKSIDLDANTYQKGTVLKTKLKQYIDTMAGFNGKTLQGANIRVSHISERVLDLAIPHKGTIEQRDVIEQIINYGKTKGVRVNPIIH